MRLATNVWHGQMYAKGTLVERQPPPHPESTGTVWLRVVGGVDDGRLIQCFPHELEA